MATPDLDVIKDIPGYKVILKAVLKSQIQQLVQQLATHTDEESVILTASVADGTLSHLGSESGKGFLEDHEDIKSQFLGFCLKNHHKKKRLEKEREETEKMLQMSSESISVSPGHYMNTFTPRGRGGSHAYPFVSLHTSQSTRHQPYPASSPRRANQNFSPNSGKVQNKIPESTSSGSLVKIEMDSENESLDQASSVSVAQSIRMNTSGSEVRAGVSERDNDTQSSTSTIVNEPSSEGVGFDSNSEPTTSADLNETDQDASVCVKLEPQSEQDLEITGVEPGRSLLPQNSWDPNVSMGMNFDPSDDMGSLGDTTAQTNNNLVKLENEMESVDSADEQLELSMSEEEEDDCKEVKVPGVMDGSLVKVGNATNQCAICEKIYSNKYNLRKHIRIVHSDTVRCTKCGVVCDTDEKLKKHIREVHDSRRVMCEDCGLVCVTKQSLRRHRIIKHNMEHSEKKVCPYESCGRVFAEQHKLEHHVNKHLNVKPYNCENCEKSFSSRFEKNRHARACGVSKLSSYICDLCYKTFSTKQNLHIHKQSKHDKKTYICSCGKSFKYITGLYKHKKDETH